MTDEIDALVIGAGPAGLMAAQELAIAGRRVTIVDAKPSVGRKFLMAGKSGLNLTMDQSFDHFLENFGESKERLTPILAAFGPEAVQDWATDLGQTVFTGSSGRVFPTAMKASPLLRAWLARLNDLGVEILTRHRWIGCEKGQFNFESPVGTKIFEPRVAVLALGGASWARLGSDGNWAKALNELGIAIDPFLASNAGLVVNWSDHMRKHFGSPVKGVALHTGGKVERGEFIIGQGGLEGGGIYSISSAVRNGDAIHLDLLPDWSAEKIAKRISAQKSSGSITNVLRKALKLSPAKLALLMEFGRPLPDMNLLPGLLKRVPVRHDGLRPLDEAISTVGGVPWSAVDATLMLKKLPGVFVAGEMVDWDAPTGGYLLTACLAMGHWAGQRAANWN